MAKKYLRLILFLVLILSSELVIGQGQSPNHRPPVPPGRDRVPIDGGVVGLLILGAGYAVKKIHDNSKK
ncbi:PID-CTERM protein-sorting domain-containing protein [Lutimonas zeaxanthinifaciens]|uniref:PID-CTERM protein-sorting domain-containing protein n=1 Tax=Lutimonas zeaxanthinifaciens TaxID=3060215 RepID=UPI00265D1601|nr:hypothetical protein [Lutimonas sp. YSD2104]WKK65785.1 hypothetical protein QZH61_14500 [Lutimonas sp. YSD2104]